MTALDEALDDLRRALKALDVEIEDRDIFWNGAFEPMMSLAPGLVVWIGVRDGFRWPGPNYRLKSHPLDDALGAARLIVPLYRERCEAVERGAQAHPI